MSKANLLKDVGRHASSFGWALLTLEHYLSLQTLSRVRLAAIPASAKDACKCEEDDRKSLRFVH